MYRLPKFTCIKCEYFQIELHNERGSPKSPCKINVGKKFMGLKISGVKISMFQLPFSISVFFFHKCFEGSVPLQYLLSTYSIPTWLKTFYTELITCGFYGFLLFSVFVLTIYFSNYEYL